MVLTSFFQAPRHLAETVQDFAVVGALLAVPVAVWLLWRPSRKHEETGRLPVVLPTTLPVLGNLLDFLRNKDARHDWFAALGEQYGGRPFQFRIPGRPPHSIIYTPEAVEQVLKTHFDRAPKGPVQQTHLRDLFGHGIFAVDGADWVHQRKTASNLFTARALRDTMTESMRRYTVVLLRILERASESCEEVDVFKLLNKFTIEAFSKMAFGINMNCLESDVDHPFQKAFDSAQRITVLRLQRPVWFWKAQRFLDVGLEAQLKKDLAVIDKTVLDIIRQSMEHRTDVRRLDDGHPDIVSLFINRLDDSKDGEIDPVFLRDIVVNFLLAGRDSTAQAMSWCLYNLSKCPDVVAKIREEIAHVIPGLVEGQRTDPPTMEEVQHLVYLDAVLKETLRLYPSVPLIPKSVAQDILLPDGTLLRAGTILTISTYTMGRMEFIWGPDAKQFRPERWIHPVTGKMIAVSTFQFISFNAGPRMCLGMNLAMLEMKIVLSSLLARFNVAILPGQNVTYDNSLTLPVKGSLLARVQTVET